MATTFSWGTPKPPIQALPCGKTWDTVVQTRYLVDLRGARTGAKLQGKAKWRVLWGGPFVAATSPQRWNIEELRPAY